MGQIRDSTNYNLEGYEKDRPHPPNKYPLFRVPPAVLLPEGAVYSTRVNLELRHTSKYAAIEFIEKKSN